MNENKLIQAHKSGNAGITNQLRLASVEFPMLKKSAFHNTPRHAHLPQLEHGDMHENVLYHTYSVLMYTHNIAHNKLKFRCLYMGTQQ